ncbi:thymidylate synthase [candidate division TA06 bacterium]|uniref:Thymidylate synthase n=1 Tax=candidate division TA06 bacterium TaxID=2250710 RepID=A0A933I9A3_UNCT6|nr:thymidylate synthase [candidate division TA06 bacterium]
MQEYLDLVKHILDNGTAQKNRTGVDALSCFACFYQVDLQKGFPLLTTKKVNFEAMLHELFWYLSGQAHIRELREKTRIWDAWADGEGRLETAYGRFWRRFPVPSKAAEGEKWGSRWVTQDPETGDRVFDQIRYIRDILKEIKQNPATPNRRRMVVTAWHPGNAAESKLPPCHYTFCFNVIGERLNCHLTQRSGDVALGIPFNLACYSLLNMMLAQETGFKPGRFAHAIIDAHIYANHIEGLKQQLTREPKKLPNVHIAAKPFFELTSSDISLEGYDPHPGIKFALAV